MTEQVGIFREHREKELVKWDEEASVEKQDGTEEEEQSHVEVKTEDEDSNASRCS